MDRALWLLIFLRARGAMRRMFRRVRGWRGALALAAGILLLISWVLPGLLMLLKSRLGATGDEAAMLAAAEERGANVLLYGPWVLLGVCLLPLLTGQTQAVAFAPAEIEFLFAGPFKRRQLLGYKVVINAIGAAVFAVFIGLWMSRWASHWIAPWPAAFLSLVLTQLFGMLIAVVGSAVGRHAFSAARKVVLAAFLVAVAGLLWVWLGPGDGGVSLEWLRERAGSTPARIVLAPFSVFIRMLTATTAAGVAGWGAAGLAVNALIFAAVVRLDHHATEAALHASERQAAMRERFSRGPGGAAAGWVGARWAFPWPMPPGGWLGGAGPIAWRQATTCLRGAPGWMLSTAIMLACVVGFGLWTRLGRPLPEGTLPAVATQVTVMLTLFQTVLLRFDFRADLERMESIKALPLRPISIAVGQMATPVAFMTVSQWLLAGAGYAMFPKYAWAFVIAAVAAPGLNTMLVGVENLMFLLYPSRPPTGPVLEIQRVGRGTFVSLAKFAVSLLGGAAVGAAGAAAYYATGGSWTAAVIAGWIALAAVVWGVIIAVARAFVRFDVSRDVG